MRLARQPGRCRRRQGVVGDGVGEGHCRGFGRHLRGRVKKPCVSIQIHQGVKTTPRATVNADLLIQNEGSVLFNDALNTFFFTDICRTFLVKDCSDSKRGNLLLPLHGLLFPISSTDSIIYIYHPTDRIAHTSRGALAGMRNSPMGPP